MKKSTLLFTVLFTVAVLLLGCSEKSVHSELKEEKSINESLAEDLLAEFQDNLGGWNACVVYDGVEYTSLDNFHNRNK